MDNGLEEAPSQATVTEAPFHWSARAEKPAEGEHLVYIYIYIHEHEAIHKPISENNIGAPWVPQKGAGRGDLAQHQLITGFQWQLLMLIPSLAARSSLQ